MIFTWISLFSSVALSICFGCSWITKLWPEMEARARPNGNLPHRVKGSPFPVLPLLLTLTAAWQAEGMGLEMPPLKRLEVRRYLSSLRQRLCHKSWLENSEVWWSPKLSLQLAMPHLTRYPCILKLANVSSPWARKNSKCISFWIWILLFYKAKCLWGFFFFNLFACFWQINTN